MPTHGTHFYTAGTHTFPMEGQRVNSSALVAQMGSATIIQRRKVAHGEDRGLKVSYLFNKLHLKMNHTIKNMD